MLGAISGAIDRAVHLMFGAKGDVLSRAVRRVKGEIEYLSSRTVHGIIYNVLSHSLNHSLARWPVAVRELAWFEYPR